MAENENSVGVCLTCVFQESCITFQTSKKSETTILYCEKYKAMVESSEVIGEENKRKKESAFDDDDAAKSFQSPKGLCLNCDDAKICKFASFGNDVLFCEEHSSNFEKKKRRASDTIKYDIPRLEMKKFILG